MQREFVLCNKLITIFTYSGFISNGFRWHHGKLSRLDGENILNEVFMQCNKVCWLVRISPATELPAVSKVFSKGHEVSLIRKIIA